MYRTKLTKEQLAYNLAYHLEREADKSTHEVIIEMLVAYEENSKNSDKTLDKE